MAPSSPYIVILCGGTGPRLWPLSRANHPKQFLQIFSHQSLLQTTIARAKKIVPLKNIYVVSNLKYKNEIRKQIGNLNLLLEPEKKNTALAILYATAVIKKLNPKAIIITLPADHFVGNLSKFKSDINKTTQLASRLNSALIIGTKATSPSPSFGYILPKQKLDGYSKVDHFIEKPDITLAAKLIAQKALWNSGVYTFSIPTIESETSKHHPGYFSLYQKLQSLNPQTIKQVYRLSENLPIDKVISEKSKNLIVINASFPWSDIGDWKSIYQLKKQNNGFATLDSKTQFLEVNSRHCLISTSSQKLIGLVGVNNLAIIDTPDALLICNIAYTDSYNVRDLVTKIVENPKTKKYFLQK